MPRDVVLQHAPLLLCSLIVGVAGIVGLYFDPYCPIASFTSLPVTTIGLICAGICAATYVILLACRYFLVEASINAQYYPRDVRPPSLAGQTVVNAVVILVLWLPYLLLCYPGSVPSDGIYQLMMALGHMPLTKAHPVFTTMLLGEVFRIGSAVSDNFGVFLNVLLQSVCCAAIYGYLTAWVSSRLTNRFARVGLIVFYGVVPAWGAWAQTLGKDTLYYALFALFVLLVAQELLEGTHPARLAALAIVGTLLCLFRKEAVAVVALSLLVAVASDVGRRIWLLLPLSLALVASVAFGRFASIGLVEEVAYNSYDGLSVMFQQTARTVAAHGSELSDEDRASIDAVLGIDDLAERYNPYCADPVKDRIPSTVTDDQFHAYVKTWFHGLAAYPSTYLAAYLEHSFGYLYPLYMYEGLDQYKFYIKGEPFNTGQLDLHYANEGYKSTVAQTVKRVSDLPGVGLLDNCGTYGVMLLLLTALICSSPNRRLVVALVPMLLCLLVCLVSPVNAYLRYAMPNMAAMPVAWCVAVWSYYGAPRGGHEER